MNRAPPPATAQPSSGGSFLGNIGASITEGLCFLSVSFGDFLKHCCFIDWWFGWIWFLMMCLFYLEQ